MKKTMLLTALLALLVLLCACGSAAPAATSAPESTDAASIEPDITPAPETPEIIPIKPAEYVTVTLYLPNDNADGFDEKEASLLPDATALLGALAAEGVLRDGIIVNSFEQSGDALTLDLNDEFTQSLFGQGTAGETMVIGSVVNTFLAAFNARQITITVDGEPFETGHSIYDFAFEHIDG